ncbi:hypothetical protein DYBT9275_04377 [Dyadobacter sp. CECT 9275]|uniref:FecR family protein n=1 Tax=Dyadobacter helix TaxID=2822344 RepID=A0A916JF30_9BACT|nr:FecR family protein [Dyadobacter sp. CECT 9275]CAG5008881.1 hypothetical protein DYBT9275_04377 [Dyadobacter sp. CECT 9275]
MLDKYRLYDAEDFLQDDWFRQSLEGNNPAATQYWDNWLKVYPEKEAEVLRAKALFEAFKTDHGSLTQEEINTTIDRTLERVAGIKRESEFPERPLFAWRWLSYVASVMLISGMAIYFVKDNKIGTKITTVKTQPPAMGWVKEENVGQHPRLVKLPEGSKVTLEPGAILTYPTNFNKYERRTFLRGNAFFDVAKDPDKPFFVVGETVITRVLGTSFWIRDDPDHQKIAVIVKSGKVAVSARHGSGQNLTSDAVFLTPNQMAVFSPETEQLTRELVEKPVVISTSASLSASYEDVPIIRILKELEDAYGVKITYDAEVLKNCQISASFANETFFEKLESICLSVRASFREENGQIIIDSKGCNY